ncbi:MAG TPA: hypothetical protein VF759_17755 [Allosphingosinicella sp.]|jgi:hypothetical protein
MDHDEDMIRRTLDALERLMRMFNVERIIYLLCALTSFALLLWCIWSLFDSNKITVPQLALVFGASGLIAASAARVSFFLNKSFDLISIIVQHLAGIDKPGGPK